MRCLLFVFMLMALSAGAQNDWENLNVLQRNRMRSHAFYIPFDNREQALVWDVENSSRYLSLNGVWKFKWVSKPADRPMDFYKVGYDVRKWDNIEVPSNWELKATEYRFTWKQDSVLKPSGRMWTRRTIRLVLTRGHSVYPMIGLGTRSCYILGP